MKNRRWKRRSTNDSQSKTESSAYSVISYYDTLSGLYNRSRFSSAKDRVVRDVEEETIQAFSRKAQGYRALDVGAGTGRIARLLDNHFVKTVLVDGSSGMTKILASSTETRDIPVVTAVLGRLPFRDGIFDLAACIRVLWHIADLETSLKELARVVRPYGHVLFDVTNTASLTHVGARIRGVEVYTKFINRRDLASALHRAGLTVVERTQYKSFATQLFPDRIRSGASCESGLLELEKFSRRLPVRLCTFSLLLTRKRVAA